VQLDCPWCGKRAISAWQKMNPTGTFWICAACTKRVGARFDLWKVWLPFLLVGNVLAGQLHRGIASSMLIGATLGVALPFGIFLWVPLDKR
jgi:hypothetical protein